NCRGSEVRQRLDKRSLGTIAGVRILPVYAEQSRKRAVYRRLFCSWRTQKISFSANWILRGVPGVLGRIPTAGLYVRTEKTAGLGEAKFVWLVTLKASARNCKVRFSSMVNFLNSDVSRINRPGPVKNPRGELPKVPDRGSTNALGSKYRPVFLKPSTPRITGPLKSEFRLGTSGVPFESPVPEILDPAMGVNGKPL